MQRAMPAKRLISFHILCDARAADVKDQAISGNGPNHSDSKYFTQNAKTVAHFQLE